MLSVPVVSSTGKPLMPCHPARARELVRKGKAARRFDRGLFYISLTDRPDGEKQPIAVGIDPGSKKEGFTVKSESQTYLNIQADAVTWVKSAVSTRSQMRRARRFRKTPCRQPRFNRKRGGLPPSTKARWQWRLRISRWIARLYPVAAFVVEDIKAITKGKRRWDRTFSPLQIGKQWFYDELQKLAPVHLKAGWETKELRDRHGLKKTRKKTAEVFEAHCVDSWVLANGWVGGHQQPDNTRMLCITPLRLHRRQLHRLQPQKGGIRKAYGSTRSHEFKRGSLVKHPKFGLSYVGGCKSDGISLHHAATGKRLTQSAKPSDCMFLTFNTWRTRLLPCLKAGISAA
ncbi:RRXRR domain-containing protein [Ectothiorhodospira haloalkaliphila]|uniref:RRXRR domain-containing protein n=1 Tax=Ectothiorhodospira haloalkaliphila TaxID=421628 RepID=UPI001EE8564B|nr:RRXRR domain-containing protein [Ectothiorhodospira haloalkaliphila]MCG5526180.1 RRXRR domain-containing protein [Ectothiorhodospira haloalkaliphila]